MSWMAWVGVAVPILLGGVLLRYFWSRGGRGISPQPRQQTTQPQYKFLSTTWKGIKGIPLGILWIAACFGAAMVAMVALWLFVGLVGLLYGDRPARATPAAVSPEEMPPSLTADQMEDRFYPATGGPRAQGWETIPMQTLVNYPLQKGRSPVVYADLNLAKMEGGHLKVEWPEDPGWRVFKTFVRTEEGGDWQALKKEWCSDEFMGSENSVYLYGEAERDPGHPHGIFLTAKDPPDGKIRIRTQRLAATGEAAVWGPLFTELEGRPVKWELHVQFLLPDGAVIPAKMLKDYPARVVIGDDGKDVYPCSSSIFTATSNWPKQPGDLLIGCPHIPGGTLVQVILLVEEW